MVDPPPHWRRAAAACSLLLACYGGGDRPQLRLHDRPPERGALTIVLPSGQVQHLDLADLRDHAEPLPGAVTYLVEAFPERTIGAATVLPLARLVQLLELEDAVDLVLADCNDRYQANYTRAQLATNAPYLVVTIDDQLFPRWIADIGAPHFGPLLISLSREDGLLDPIHKSPWGVHRLTFTREADAWASLATARAAHPRGFAIYADACLNCHAPGDGPVGGRLSSRGLNALTGYARANPGYLLEVLRDPQGALRDPSTKMPGFAHYSDEDRRALLAFLAALHHS
jgi:mono/diheme cytochrome c family protein